MTPLTYEKVICDRNQNFVIFLLLLLSQPRMGNFFIITQQEVVKVERDKVLILFSQQIIFNLALIGNTGFFFLSFLQIISLVIIDNLFNS